MEYIQSIVLKKTLKSYAFSIIHIAHHCTSTCIQTTIFASFQIEKLLEINSELFKSLISWWISEIIVEY